MNHKELKPNLYFTGTAFLLGLSWFNLKLAYLTKLSSGEILWFFSSEVLIPTVSTFIASSLLISAILKASNKAGKIFFLGALVGVFSCLLSSILACGAAFLFINLYQLETRTLSTAFVELILGMPLYCLITGLLAVFLNKLENKAQ